MGFPVLITLRRVYLLLWKNSLLMRRHYIITTLEIFLPTFLALVLAFMRLKYSGNYSSLEDMTYYPRVSENSLGGSASTAFSNDPYGGNPTRRYSKKCTVVFAPDNAQTRFIMEKAREKIPSAYFDLEGYSSEEMIEELLSKILPKRQERYGNDPYYDLDDSCKLRAAVVFEKGFDKSRENFASDHKISYKIRLVDRFTESIHSLLHPDDLTATRYDRFGGNEYVRTGFSGLQIALDKSIIEFMTGEQPRVIITIDTQAFPYPAYIRPGYFILFLRGKNGFSLSSLLVLGFVFIVPSIIRNVVSEKETGIKELMKMVGLPNWMHWLGWMLNSMIILISSVTIIIAFFFIPIGISGVIAYGDPSLWWFVLSLYVISATAFCFFISTFFQKPTIATTIGIVVWLVSYYGVAIPIDSIYQDMSLLEKMVSALLPNMALHLAIKAMVAMEEMGIGAQWSNIADPISSVDELSVGLMCLMFVLDTILYMCLTVYFENILPSEFGVRKPWYYPIKPPFAFIARVLRKVRIGKVASRVNSSHDGSPGFEAEEPGLTPGIIIQNLRKRFGHKVAVDGVSLRIFNGQITALLGHNGAGKTTTMNILSGMFAPTSGTAVVNGYNVGTQLEKVRSSLGLCPQHNLLFDELTVEQHLIWFGRLKGLSKSEATNEMTTLLGRMQLREKQKVPSRALSGGQKRKLSLGMALTGGTKVVILDEPTSGMDPETRRAIWDILLGMRGERTILLTTHFMEEADVLGDRIAIMSSGQIKCCGSPLYLKRFYGAGYTLKMTLQPNSDADLILNTVQKHVPSASFKSDQYSNPSEIGITIPSEGNSTSLFPPMFSDLTQNKQSLGILTMGLSLTTMDEVFVKVGEIYDDKGQKIEVNETQVSTTPEVNSEIPEPALHLERASGIALISERIWAVLLKKLNYTLRKRNLLITQFIILLSMVIAAILISNIGFRTSKPKGALRISLKDYKNAKTLYHSNNKTLAESYKSVVGSPAKFSTNISAELLKIDIARFRYTIVAADLRVKFRRSKKATLFNINALHSSLPYHSHPLAINFASNTILRMLTPTMKYSIDVTNHPLEAFKFNIKAADPNTVAAIVFGVFIPIGLGLFAASYIVFPMEEKISKAKQLQLMTGLSPLSYWGTSFVWDFLMMGFISTIILLCFPIFQTFGAFTAHGGLGVLYLILVVYGFSAISFSYLCSIFANTIAEGYSLVTMIHLLTGVIMGPIVHVLDEGGDSMYSPSIRFFGRLFPTFGVTVCVMRYIRLSTKNSRCNFLTEHDMSIVCNEDNNVKPQMRECCRDCKTFSETTCFKPDPYLNWSSPREIENILVPDIGQDLFYLFLIGILYKCLILLAEYGIIQRLKAIIFKSENSTFTNVCSDKDVIAESQRVQSMVQTGTTSKDALVVNGLCKSYGSFAAVSNLSFGVHYGECFGLLGVNGAGKTTSFRMLTGDEIRSSGNAFSFNSTLDTNRKKFLGSIGYCPQFDGIIGVLTGREILELFSRLRGTRATLVRSEADNWLHKMGLHESGNVQCQNYSGGMKRRLSAAMALIGDPPIVMLDEPTSGVDPVARRQFWKIISEVRNAGQAVILTSHSMEECEALCSRLGIMVNGQFQCMGGVQHLKNKFVQGFSLVLKLKPLIPPESPQLKSLSADIKNKFNPCVLKDQHQNVLNYQVHNTTIPWDVMFQTMEDLRVQYEDIIEDYAVNETTLEEVFLSFARKQYPNRTAEVSCFKKYITCQC